MAGSIAVVVGASGGIGSALVRNLEGAGQYDEVLCLSRSSAPPLDLLDQGSVEAAAQWVKTQAEAAGEIRLVFDATGALTLGDVRPEKSLRDVDPELLARSYAVNAIGPAMLMKHFLPLLPRHGRSVFATLSARVGSIGDNRLGGWYGYRAAKAALNQMVRSAAVELARKKPEAICLALHPGTVRTPLTEGFAKSGLDVQDPDEAAGRLLAVLDKLETADSGGFFDQRGEAVPW